MVILFLGKVKLYDLFKGPAVFNGGFSTFLAFVLLAGSKSHVFMTFFKVFLLVVVFGLYNGLFVLPVVLSLIGPTSYLTDDNVANETVKEEEEPLKPIIKRNNEEQIELPKV